MTLPKVRAVSSAGSERLPYKQDVGGSSPSSPTKKKYGVVAQLVRVLDCRSSGCGFESRRLRQSIAKNNIV